MGVVGAKTPRKGLGDVGAISPRLPALAHGTADASKSSHMSRDMLAAGGGMTVGPWAKAMAS